MAIVDLPATPGPVDLQWQPIDYGGTLQGALGGEAQRINRLGNRFALTVTLPRMAENAARPWIAALMTGLREGVRWQLRQVELAIGAPGSPVANGDGQAGNAIAVRSGAAGYGVRAGQFLSITTDGDRYLYMAAADVTLNGSGAGSIAIEPPLRAEAADGDAINLAAPVIEGLLSQGPVPWTIDAARRFGLQFTITEAR